MGKKEPVFVHYLPTVIESSKSTTKQYLRVIYFSGQILNITKSWCLSIPYFLIVTSLIMIHSDNTHSLAHTSASASSLEERLDTEKFHSFYWLSSFYQCWHVKHKFKHFLTQFWVNDVTTGVKTTIVLESFIKYWVRSFSHPRCMIYNLLEIMISEKK